MSRKLFIPLAFASAAALVVAATPAGAAPNEDKATGGVNFLTGGGADAHASFVAMLDSRGAAKGNVNVKNHDGVDFKGDVTCYEEDGNIARFSGPITKSSGANTPPNDQGTASYLIVVQDNGEDATNPDRITIRRSDSATPEDCLGNTRTANRPITGGNLQVH